MPDRIAAALRNTVAIAAVLVAALVAPVSLALSSNPPADAAASARVVTVDWAHAFPLMAHHSWWCAKADHHAPKLECTYWSWWMPLMERPVTFRGAIRALGHGWAITRIRAAAPGRPGLWVYVGDWF